MNSHNILKILLVFLFIERLDQMEFSRAPWSVSVLCHFSWARLVYSTCSWYTVSRQEVHRTLGIQPVGQTHQLWSTGINAYWLPGKLDKTTGTRQTQIHFKTRNSKKWRKANTLWYWKWISVWWSNTSAKITTTSWSKTHVIRNVKWIVKHYFRSVQVLKPIELWT
jgi:hypothetical protein